MSSKRGSKTSGKAGPTRPARRPIPLPPESLRPPARKARGGDAAPNPAPAAGGARRSGASRGFWIGLSVPLLGFLVAGLYLGGGGLFDDGSPATGTEPEMQVRARFDQAAAGDERSGTLEPPAEGAPVRGPAVSSGSPEEASPDEDLSGGSGEVLAIQLASFRTQRKAERVLDEARERTGLPGVVLPAMVDGVRWQRILLGAFASPSDARSAARPLLNDGTIRELVIRPVPSKWVPALTGKDSK